MLAISNSELAGPQIAARQRAFGLPIKGVVTARLVLLSVVLILISTVSHGAEVPSGAVRAEEVFRNHRARYEKDPSNTEAAWRFARACFDLAEFASNDERREEIARQGIEAARRAVAANPDSAEAHLYLAVNLGQLARTKNIGALKIIHEMEHEFKKTVTLDEKLENARPGRSLGLLYRDAPGWPVNIGSKAKARRELERAVELFPEYPENRLCLAESFAKWGDKRELETEIEALTEILPKARKELTGEEPEAWADWEERWGKLQKLADKSSKRVR